MSEPIDLERLRNLLIAIPEKAHALALRAGEQSARVGYVAGAVKIFADAQNVLLNSSAPPHVTAQLVASGVTMAAELDKRLDEMTVGAATFGQLIELSIPVFSTTSSSAVATCNSICIGPSPVKFSPCPYLNDSDEVAYAQKLEMLDRGLGNTYRGAWHALYAETHDEVRASLWQMRQVMDHFFGLLAPDDRVRRSPLWSPKSGIKPDQIYRSDRWRYAADRWISDAQLRDVFVESVSVVSQAYEALNQAHERAPLDRSRAEETFRSADAVMRRWIDAIAPWPPNVIV